MKYDIKDLIKDKFIRFNYYQDGKLWFRVSTTEFSFPVPIEDCGSARFNEGEKAMLYMRWIRKHLETLEKGNE